MPEFQQGTAVTVHALLASAKNFVMIRAFCARKEREGKYHYVATSRNIHSSQNGT